MDTDRAGRTKLFYAAGQMDADEFTRYLASVDPAEITHTDANGSTPLHQAARMQRVANIITLIEAGADVEAKDHQDWTPLMCATFKGGDRTDTIQTLVEHGADPDNPSVNGKSPVEFISSISNAPQKRALLTRLSNVPTEGDRR